MTWQTIKFLLRETLHLKQGLIKIEIWRERETDEQKSHIFLLYDYNENLKTVWQHLANKRELFYMMKIYVTRIDYNVLVATITLFYGLKMID